MQIVPAVALAGSSTRVAKKNRYSVSLAATASEIREAQRLRYQVFFEEMGARSSAVIQIENAGLDIDEYDADCEHLLVRDNASGEVVGCYRIMRPETARRRGAFYADSEFDLSSLNHIRARTAEVGRACIHPAFRAGSVIMLLWSGLAQFMLENRYDYLIGCASVNLADGHDNVVAVYREMLAHHAAPNEYRVSPRRPYPLDRAINTKPSVEPTVEPISAARVPPLLKGYAKLGAWIGGAPAWDADFGTADLFVLLPIARLPVAYTKHFMGNVENLAAAA
jgi:putative hemolysin